MLIYAYSHLKMMLGRLGAFNCFASFIKIVQICLTRVKCVLATHLKRKKKRFTHKNNFRFLHYYVFVNCSAAKKRFHFEENMNFLFRSDFYLTIFFSEVGISFICTRLCSYLCIHLAKRFSHPINFRMFAICDFVFLFFVFVCFAFLHIFILSFYLCICHLMSTSTVTEEIEMAHSDY